MQPRANLEPKELHSWEVKESENNPGEGRKKQQ